MAKRKPKTRWRSRFRFRAHRKRDKRLPLSVGVGLATSLLAPSAPGWASALDQIKAQNPKGALSAFVRGWTGIYGVDGAEPVGINVMTALNPFDMSDAPAWKATFWTAIAAKVVKSVTHVDPLAKVPVVNKFVKFS